MSGIAFKRTLLGSLILVLIAIWVRNLLLLIPDVEVVNTTRESESLVVGSDSLGQRRTTRNFTLDPDQRSPFELVKRTQPKRSSEVGSIKPAKVLESIRSALIGCVFDAKKPHIVVMDSVTEMSQILRTGDTLNGFILKKITRDEVHWRSLKGRLVVWNTAK